MPLRPLVVLLCLCALLGASVAAAGDKLRAPEVASKADPKHESQTAFLAEQRDKGKRGKPLKAIAGLKLTNATRTMLSVAWLPLPQDNDGDKKGFEYDLFLDGSPAGSTTATHATLTGLSCETNHVVGVRARDARGGLSPVSEIRVSTAACDHTPPTTPSNLAVIDVSETGFTVTWNASTDDDALAGYDISFDGGPAVPTTGTSHVFAGLACGQKHHVEIVARDVSGNRSGPGAIDASTAACPPPPPPPPPPPAGADRFVSPDGADTLHRWRYVTATYDGNVVRLYVDGQEVGEKAITGAMKPSDGDVRMGGNNVFSEWFTGLLDEVRMFDRALSPDEIRAEMDSAAPQASGLVAAYSFDEGSGDAAHDGSGHANDGIVSGATWTDEGRFGGALAFDGVDDLVSVEDADALDFFDGMTLAGWVNPTTSNGWQTVVTKEAGTEEVYGLWASTDDHVPSGHVTVGVAYEARGPAPLTMNNCRETPCASLGAAYLAASLGETVEVAGGTYSGDQLLVDDPAKTGDGVVLFQPARGASVTLAGEVLVDGSHVEFRDMRMANGWQARRGADDVTFRDVSSAHLFIFSASNVNVLGGEIGPGEGLNFDSIIASAGNSAPPPTNILIKGVWFHDWSRPAGTDFHTECLQIGSAVNLTIAGNRFQRCATHDIFIRSWGDVNGSQSPLRDILIQNNFLDATLDGFYTLAVSNDLGTPDASVVIRNNSSLQGVSLDGANAHITVDANIIAFQQSFGCTATIYSYNVYESLEEGATEPCAATDLVAPVAYVDRDALDLHLAPGSAAIDRGDPGSYPGVDFDGDARPLGGAPDAGADESG